MVDDIMVEIGEQAPSFEVKDTNGKKVKLSDFKGKNLVLYFYPKDDPPGCTIEACNFREDHLLYKKRGIEVLGVSLDNQKSHQKFTKKFNLPFRLLSDENASISKKYGTYVEKSFFGRKIFGIKRTTFLIDKIGKVKHIYRTVKVKEHSKEILEMFK